MKRATRRRPELCALIFLLALSRTPQFGEPRTVKVGLFPAAPLVMEEKGKPTGFFIELLEYLAKESDWKLSYVRAPWSSLLGMLKDGEIDLLPAVGFTQEREKIYDFSANPVYVDSGVVFTSPQRPIHTIYDLRGKRIAAVQGSIFTSNFVDYLRSFGLECEIVTTSDNEAVMAAIEGGEADAGVCIYSLGSELAKRHRVAITPISFSPIALGFATPKGKDTEILQDINRLMPPMIADSGSVYAKLYAKWTGQSEKARIPPWLWWSILALAAVGLLLLLWNVSLNRQVRRKTLQLETEAEETREAKERIQQDLAEKEVLLRELYHRTKNSLLMISSLLGLQASEHPKDSALERVVSDTDDRIQAMALVHEMLYQTRNLSSLAADDYVARLARLIVAEYAASPSRIELICAIASFELDFDVAIPLGLVVSELMTNSLRYAFPANARGSIKIEIRKCGDGEYEFLYADDGIGFPAGYDYQHPRTLGLKLVYSIGEGQLKGKVDLESGKGVSCRIRFAPEGSKDRTGSVSNLSDFEARGQIERV